LLWMSVTTSPLFDAEGDVEYVVAAFSDITERRAAAESLRYRATHDALTGLANRTLLFERLGEIVESPGIGRTHALLYCDLDDFKVLNDRYGHAVGDRVLVNVAQRLTRVSRSSDLVARIGGDEFVILAEDAGLDEGVRLAQRLRESIAAPFEID